MNKWWWKVLLIGVLLRVFLMPVTFHPDLWGHSFVAYFFAYKGEVNIYDFLLKLPDDYPLVKNFGVGDIFIYPPLTYFTLGFFRILVKPFADPNFIPWLMENTSNVLNYRGLGLQIFLFKFPYLFIDITTAFLLSSLFDDFKKKKQAFILWMFNPLTLYATFMMGQLDILPVLFTVLTCYLIKNKKFVYALIALGIGGSYKMYPLLLIPPAAFLLGDTFKLKIKLLLAGFIPFILTIMPFLNSAGFRQMVLFGPKNQKMLFMNWPLSGAEKIYPFVLILVFIYLYSYYSKKRVAIEIYFLSILLLIFSVTHFHPQWFLWVTPFIIWTLVKNSFKGVEIAILMFLSWFVITLFFEPSLSIGLFAPLWHNLANAKGLTEIFSKYTDVFQFKSIVRSAFAGASIYYIINLLKGTENKNETS